MKNRFSFFVASILALVFLSACSTKTPSAPPEATTPPAETTASHPKIPISNPSTPTDIVIPAANAKDFGDAVQYEAPTVSIAPDVSKDFDLKTVQNLKNMETDYGFKFTEAELSFLSKNKFVVKNLLDTSIRPNSSGDNVREFLQLFSKVSGPTDAHDRKPSNAVFYTSDVFFHTYNNLFTELLKEMENKTFYPSMKSLSAAFFEASQKKLDAAASDQDKQTWMKIRNYFAIPYAIFSTAAEPLGVASYDGRDPSEVMADYKTKDSTVDTYDQVSAFLKGLKLDSESEKATLADLQQIYDAKGKGVPAVFEKDYSDYAKLTGIEFKVDFTQFTPRGTYTSSSLRRQYFRGMKWYIMIPFFLKSPALTTYSYGIAQLMAENPKPLSDYNTLEATINFMVGKSDDLMPADYLEALRSGKGSTDPAAAAMEYLVKAHDPKIKDVAAFYPTVGDQQTDETRLLTKGMRFFSGKFILDSYWTGALTQGDEAPRPGYTQKLPPMASALEVMGLLGSDYAKTQIPKLDFYKPSNSKAIDQAMKELGQETGQITEKTWSENLYYSWLNTIRSLFSWQKANLAQLPRFMQSTPWEIKTLMTASGFWTELRHATILYAKQSFAELGGGGPGCDTRAIPAPPKAYIEPQPEAYARLLYLAKRTEQGLKDQGFELQNMIPLGNFISLMGKVQNYVQKELANQTLNEKTTTQTLGEDDAGKPCVTHQIDGTSDWEDMRVGIVAQLKDSLPIPTEGPILPAKDRRAALVADVHTGGDSENPTAILYEGEGVPNVIFTTVSDANGPRLTVGFTYSHYEFTEPYGGKRKTDEDWQTQFYTGDDPYNAYDYTKKSSWPKPNFWYLPILDLK